MQNESGGEDRQTPLPGMEKGEPTEYLLTVEDAGLEYAVIVEAMTKQEARDTFDEEYTFFELGIYIDPDAFGVDEDDDDWTHEALFARTAENAREIALNREQKYIEVYDTEPLPSDTTIVSVDPVESITGSRVRQAKRDVEVVPR